MWVSGTLLLCKCNVSPPVHEYPRYMGILPACSYLTFPRESNPTFHGYPRYMDIHHACTARKIQLMYFFSGNCAASAPISTSMCLRAIYIQYCIPRIGPLISLIGRPILEYVNFWQIYECRNWETEHYNCVLEITVSFLGIHKWEQDIYIWFSPALLSQCALTYT